MLVHQCSSCQKLSSHKGLSEQLPPLPGNWTRITIDTGYTNAVIPRHKQTYDLCVTCSKMPITFGNITLSGQP